MTIFKYSPSESLLPAPKQARRRPTAREILERMGRDNTPGSLSHAGWARNALRFLADPERPILSEPDTRKKNAEASETRRERRRFFVLNRGKAA